MSHTGITLDQVSGALGWAHLAAFRTLPEHFDVGVICDLDGAKAQRLADEFSIPRVTTDIAELYRMDEQDEHHPLARR